MISETGIRPYICLSLIHILLDGRETFRLQLYDIQDEKETAIASFYEGIRDAFVLMKSCITVSEGVFLLLLHKGDENAPAVMEFLEHCGVRQACVVTVSYTHLDVYKRQV